MGRSAWFSNNKIGRQPVLITEVTLADQLGMAAPEEDDDPELIQSTTLGNNFMETVHRLCANDPTLTAVLLKG
jgi:hypothetical protein